MPAQLKISDGTTEISLIDIGPGIHLNDWTPAITQYKAGGVFRDNPQTSGRRLVQKQFDNAIESFDLKVNNLKRNTLIYQMQELLRLLEKATDYWTSDWQNTVVYLIAQAECEDNARYAEIVSYSIPQLDNPYSQPFLSSDGNAVFDAITLGVERKHWKSNIPGNGTAVAISGTQDYDGRTLGRAATTSEKEVAIGNKHVVANLTDIYIDDGGVFGSNLMDASLPYSLLPASPAVNDAIYFGIDTSVTDSGPFSSLVFDIGTALSGTLTITWEYWNGSSWGTLTVATNGSTLGTTPFTSTGVKMTVWENPSDWVATSVNSITAFWVRARVSAFTSASAIPTQQNRDIYSAILPYVNVDSAQVVGDIPSLSRILVDQQALITTLYADRTLVGLRSTSRGSSFTAFLNCSDDQEPDDIYSVGLSTDAAFANDNAAATGRRVTFNPSGIVPLEPRIVFDLTTSQRSFFGTYHVFVRCRQVGGNTGDINIRLLVGIGGGKELAKTSTKPILLTSNWHLVDLGTIALSPRELLNSSEEYIIFNINIEADCTNASPPDAYFSDVILLPIDEWAIDTFTSLYIFEQQAIWGRLDVDSIVHPKEKIRTLYRGTNVAPGDDIFFLPIDISNGEAILQANSTQRLWHIFANYDLLSGTHTGSNNASTLTDAAADFVNRGVEIGMRIDNITDGSFAAITAVTATTISGTLTGGTDNDWDTSDSYRIVTDKWVSRVEQSAFVAAQKNQRYLGMRGNR